MTEVSETEEKNKGGRPLVFKSVEELDSAINAYFDMQNPHLEDRMVDSGVNEKGETIFLRRKVMTQQKPYTMSGLALALGVNRRTLLDYSKKDQFSPTLEAAKARCESYAESQLFGPFANGAKFNLINNYRGRHQDWSDRQELTGAEGAPLMPIGLDSAILARMQDRGETPPVTTEDSGE
ncbi:terminase small subunit [Rhodococcus sp. NPDC056516]|uniref:terminase small subunit n=1 Tax=Rhodococcus sp. NPDC056516 TaxID=3345847 RepID=UPI00366CB723